MLPSEREAGAPDGACMPLHALLEMIAALVANVPYKP
jgi:hypothetical protein